MRPPDGFTVRAATPDDIQEAAAIVRAEEKRLRGTSLWGVGDMSDFWRGVNFAEAAWAVEHDGKLVAFGAGVERPKRTDWWISVHPDFVARGISTWLLEQAERRSRAIGAPAMDVGAFAENAAALQLFERLGFREARHYFQLRIGLEQEPEPPQVPAGLALDTFRPDDAHAFHSAMNEAFADDPGHVPMPFEDWQRIRLEAPDTDLSLWFVVRDADEIAGFARCDADREGGGWVGILGVRQPWRRRGVARALLQATFCEFRRRGEPHVGLAVDAENATGATRLYERAGMRVLKEDIVYEKELT